MAWLALFPSEATPRSTTRWLPAGVASTWCNVIEVVPDPLVLALTTTMSRWALQIRPMQKGVAPVQEVAQFPQCAAVSMLVSHPRAALPHAPQPSSHAGMQWSAMQPVAPACKRPHLTLHAPQLLGSDDTGVSQPLIRLESQSSKPVTHDGLQALAMHSLLEVLLSWQPTPHAPQLALLTRLSVSQPLLGSPSQVS